MKYLLAVLLGIVFVNAGKFYRGMPGDRPLHQDIEIAEDNPSGVNLGATIMAMTRQLENINLETPGDKPGEEWFGKNVMKSVDYEKEESVIVVRPPNSDQVKEETVKFSEVQRMLYSTDIKWPDSVAVALIKAGWYKNPDGTLGSMEVPHALKALTGINSVTLYKKGETDIKTLEGFKNLLNGLAKKATPIILQTGDGASKCKKKYAYSVFFPEPGRPALEDGAVKDGGQAYYITPEEFFKDAAYVFGLEGGYELK